MTDLATNAAIVLAAIVLVMGVLVMGVDRDETTARIGRDVTTVLAGPGVMTGRIVMTGHAGMTVRTVMTGHAGMTVRTVMTGVVDVATSARIAMTGVVGDAMTVRGVMIAAVVGGETIARTVEANAVRTAAVPGMIREAMIGAHRGGTSHLVQA